MKFSRDFSALFQQNKHIRFTFFFSLLVFCTAMDFITGPLVQFPVVFLLPVALVSWYDGIRWGMFIAFVLPVCRMIFNLFWTAPWTLWDSLINTFIRMAVFSLFAILIARVSRQHKLLSRKIKILEGMLPVCCICKKIRTEKGEWEQIEKYITDHSEAEFSHGLCPECLKSHYPEYSLKQSR